MNHVFIFDSLWDSIPAEDSHNVHFEIQHLQKIYITFASEIQYLQQIHIVFAKSTFIHKPSLNISAYHW